MAGGGTTTLPDADVEERTRLLPPWRVVLHDDPVTTMEFVVELLVSVFGKPPVEAVRLMLEVHHGGAATITVCPQERAELYVEQVVSLSRGRGFPLAATAEPGSRALFQLTMPDMRGLEVTIALRERFPKALIVIATMYDAYSLMEEAFTKGCNVFLVKPHGFMELFKRLTTMEMDELRATQRLVIDQYGPREFKPTATP